MSLEIKNSRELVTPENLRLKILFYAPSGFGKTTFAGSALDPGFAVCETGQGKGLVSVADRGLSYVEPTSYQEFEAFCSGQVFKDKETLVVDSLTEMTRTFITDYAIGYVQRKQGNTEKRDLGIPELDDYQAIGALTRRLIRKLLDQPKHIVVTATEAAYDPPVMDPKNPARNRAERLGGPDLPGVMRVAAPAMFDITIRGVIKPRLLNPQDARSRVMERWLVTELDDKHAGKNRMVVAGKSVFPTEVKFDLNDGTGSFKWFLDRVVEAHKAAAASAQQ